MIKKFRKRALVLASIGVLGIAPITHASLGNIQNQVISGVINDGGAYKKRDKKLLAAIRESLDITLLIQANFIPSYRPVLNYSARLDVGLQVVPFSNNLTLYRNTILIPVTLTPVFDYKVTGNINLVITGLQNTGHTKSPASNIPINLVLSPVRLDGSKSSSDIIKNVTRDTLTGKALDRILPSELGKLPVSDLRSRVTLNFVLSAGDFDSRQKNSNHNKTALNLTFDLTIKYYPTVNTFEQSHFTKKANIGLALIPLNRSLINHNLKSDTNNNNDDIEKLLLLLAVVLSRDD